MRWKVWELKQKEIKQKFEERVVELVDADSKDLWGSYEKRVLQACDELSGKTKARGIGETHGGGTSKQGMR